MNARCSRVDARLLERGFEWVVFVSVVDARDQLGEAVDRVGPHAQDLAHLPHRKPRAVSDDVGRHRRTAFAVLMEDVLNDGFALVAGGQVEVDVRPFAAFFRKEALEQEFHPNGVDGGDGEGITDGTVRSRTPALHQDVLAFRKAADVVDDQEVTREPKVRDDAKLVFELFAHVTGQGRAVTAAGAFVGEPAKGVVLAFADLKGIDGEVVFEHVHPE